MMLLQGGRARRLPFLSLLTYLSEAEEVMVADGLLSSPGDSFLYVESSHAFGLIMVSNQQIHCVLTYP